MTEPQIYEQLNGIVRDVIGNDDVAISPATTARDVQGWDSFAHINIVVASEIAFGIKFQTAELERLRNVGEFVSLIMEKRAAN